MSVGVGAGMFGGWSHAVFAHRLQATTTQIDYRVHRKMLEVVHSIHLDDGVFLLRALEAGDGAEALTPMQRAKLLYYVEQNFTIGSLLDQAQGSNAEFQDRPMNLSPVGAQFDGETLWIYQEIALPSPPAGLDVRCELLHDLFPAAQNQINYRFDSVVKTLDLSRKRPRGQLRF